MNSDRTKGIGASEVWKVFDARMELYLNKVGLLEDPEENEAMWLGTNLEPVMDKRYLKETGFMPEPVEPIIHPVESWRRCSPDRIVKKNGTVVLLEYKTTGIHNGWGDPGTDEVPDRVAMQVQWQLSLLPHIQDAEVPVYFFAPRREFAIYYLKRNQEIIDNLVNAARDFWLNNVIPQVPPELDASEASGKLLKSLYPESKGEVLPAPDDAIEWRVNLEKANIRIKYWEEEKKLAQHHLEALVGDADSLLWADGWRFDWKRQKDRSVIDWKLAFDQLSLWVLDVFGTEEETKKKIMEIASAGVDFATTIKPGPRVPRLWAPKEKK